MSFTPDISRKVEYFHRAHFSTTAEGATTVEEVEALKQKVAALSNDGGGNSNSDSNAAVNSTNPNVDFVLKDLFAKAMATTFPNLAKQPEPLITANKGKGNFEYQCNNAKGLAPMLAKSTPPQKLSPQDVGEKLVANLPKSNVIGGIEVKAGFINISITNQYVADAAFEIVKRGQLDPPAVKKEKVLVDFSAPNIAKQMHVGHLRSTIIGESICRLLEFCGHEVHRINHVGDWGTQFGMLILFLKEMHPDFLETPPPIQDLNDFYKRAKQRFDEDATFKNNARLEVVKLQALDPVSIKAWEEICDISRMEFQDIYDRLNIKLEERGESFYNPAIPDTIKMLKDNGVIEENDGAQIIVSKDAKPLDKLTQGDLGKILSAHFIALKKQGAVEYSDVLVAVMREYKVLVTNENGEELVKLPGDPKPWAKFDPKTDVEKLAKALDKTIKPTLCSAFFDDIKAKSPNDLSADGKSILVPVFNIPLMVVKSDGGYTYDTTDLAASYHRFVTSDMDRVVYTTDAGQFEHFKMVCRVADDLGWISGGKRWSHAGFGIVLGEDGKRLRTRSGETIKLKDLLDTACERSLKTLKEREEGDAKQGHTEEEMVALSKKIGYGAIRYFDLKKDRSSDYIFSFDEMLDMRGNTAVFMLYQYARICSIQRKANFDFDSAVKGGRLNITHDKEKQLALKAFEFSRVLHRTHEDLFLHHLTDYVYELAGSYSEFQTNCRVMGHEEQESRLLLCELTRITIKQTLELLGIEVAERL